MRIFVVLSVYIALATCHRINREAGYNYEVSNGSYEQEPIPSIQQNSFQYNDQSLQHTASADHHFHASNQQYDEVAQNGGNANYAQPQQQIAEITNDNSNYAPVQYQHNSGSHSISAHPNEYVQQSGLDRFNAAGNTFNRNDGQHTYSQDFTDSFSTTHQHSLSTPHRLIQSDTFSRNTFPVVNPAGDSIVVEAPSAPSAPSGPSAPPAQPTPIQSVSAPIEHYPTPITETNESTVVRKDIYVHVPPPEFEEPEVIPQVVTPPPVNQKHYKILFIKTPTITQRAIPILNAPQNEEKTLVYVLVKKPEPVEPIIQQIEQPKPTKPEVYFIKYKSQKEVVGTSDTTLKTYLPAAERSNEQVHFEQARKLQSVVAAARNVQPAEYAFNGPTNQEANAREINGSYPTTHQTDSEQSTRDASNNQYIPPVSH